MSIGYCAFKMAKPNLQPQDWFCEQGYCQLWNEQLGQCGLVAIAYLKGIEIERQELYSQFKVEAEKEARP